jgi:hypothetical protein
MEQTNGDKPVPAPEDMIQKLPRTTVTEGSMSPTTLIYRYSVRLIVISQVYSYKRSALCAKMTSKSRKKRPSCHATTSSTTSASCRGSSRAGRVPSADMNSFRSRNTIRPVAHNLHHNKVPVHPDPRAGEQALASTLGAQATAAGSVDCSDGEGAVMALGVRTRGRD